MASNVVISKSGKTSVTIHTLTVIENNINPIESFDIPRVPDNYEEGDLKNFFDFLFRTRNIEVDGIIAKEQDGTTPATTLRTRLLSIFNAGGEASLTYLGETFSGALTGLEFREVPADNQAATPSYFRVRISITKATQLGT